MNHHHGRRRRRHHHETGEKRSGGCWVNGAISRVIRGSKDATGLGKGPVITLYVLGFIFMPLLTSMLFLGMLFWTTNPAKAREGVDRFTDHMKRAGRHLNDAAFGQPKRSHRATEPEFDIDEDEIFEEPTPKKARRTREPDTSREPETPAQSAKDLRERFETLEERARAIEEFVASEEYRLEREFKKMDK